MERGRKAVKTVEKESVDTAMEGKREGMQEVLMDVDSLGLEQAYYSSMASLKEGNIIKGKVVKIKSDEVIIDISYKSEGVVPKTEFLDREGKLTIKEGDEVNVFLEKIENKNGLVVLSREKAAYMVTWDKIVDSYDNQKMVDGKIIKQIKGGFEVDIGVKAFLPASQLDVRPISRIEDVVGKVFPMRIIKVNRVLNNIVLSRRIVLEEDRESKRGEIISTLQEGQIKEGIVKNITAFGAFVDLGGMDGLLHITDMSWGKIKHPSDKVSLGQKIEVKIISFDREKNKISLGLKQKTSDPWEIIGQKYQVGQIVNGKVTNLMDYGAFVEIEEGIEGLIHNSDMSWVKRITNPSQVLKVLQITPVAILSIDKDNRRLSLGLKQTQPNPWETIDRKYPIGSRVNCKVSNITDFGVFVELEEGLEGLIYITDISWTKKINHPNEVYKVGQQIEALILNVDKAKEKISLGVKQLTEDPLAEFEKTYKDKQIFNAKVNEITSNGYVVELENEFSGFLSFSEVLDGLIKKDKSELLGKTLETKVVKVDLIARQIILSQKAFAKEEEARIVEEYNKTHGSTEITLADAVKKSLKKKRTKKVGEHSEEEEKKGKKSKKDNIEELEEASDVSDN
ncbi:MAG: 30S ribosomal protein S1 [bacterium]|nr:30S ribosomal protein S1 [bacterium]